jgi:hypothetical protein
LKYNNYFEESNCGPAPAVISITYRRLENSRADRDIGGLDHGEEEEKEEDDLIPETGPCRVQV